MIAVVFNPTARGDKAATFQRRIRDLAPDARLFPTAASGDATRLAAAAAQDGARIVVAAGGDGTVNEVVNGLAQIPRPDRPALGVLPLGTVNVFAKELGLPTTLDPAWTVIRDGRTRVIDLAVARHSGGDRWFVQMAGAGLDAAAIAKVQWRIKRRIGPLAYVWAGMQALSSPLPPVRVAGGPLPVHGQLALVGNGRFYGGRFPVFPDARLNDGLLDLALLPRASILSLAKAAVAIHSGRLLRMSGVVHQQAESFDFTCPEPAQFQVEGDNVGTLPARFEVEREALDVVVARADD